MRLIENVNPWYKHNPPTEYDFKKNILILITIIIIFNIMK